MINRLSTIILLFGCLAASAQPGKKFPSERKEYKDSTTGRKVIVLTTHSGSDTKIYQTHPQWTYDGQWIIFRSARTGRGQAFAVHEKNGDIIQLTDGAGINTGSMNVCRKSNRVFYFRYNRLTELAIDPVIQSSRQGKTGDSAQFEKIIMTLPPNHRESGGFSLDANETKAYIGISYRKENDTTTYYKLCSIDLSSGAFNTIMEIPFRVGHIQANPWIAGEILYCYETGGDATQRMWMVNADGSNNRPFYKETPDEWVTHEIWMDKDNVMVNILGHLPRLRTKPHGVAIVNVRNNEIRFYKNAPGRGFWHCAGSSDGKWGVADTFTGELQRIDLQNGTLTLLTAGHYPRTEGIPDIHSHHTISPDGKRVLFNSGKYGNNDLMITYID
jgi:oligogalacturonide lyase